MLGLFINLYLAMFTGRWNNIPGVLSYTAVLKDIFNGLGTFLTSIFGDAQMLNFGDVIATTTVINFVEYPNWLVLISFVLALITSIGIVVMAVKGIKRVFSIFFMPIR